MLLLHISDIHFRAPVCTTPDLDPDRPFRTRLVQSVHDQVQKLGPIDAIVVTGDIAFKGDPVEYEVANAWLTELASEAQCDLSRIYVVPGNHDVDRKSIEGQPAVTNVHEAIYHATDAQREHTLLRQFTDGATGRTLFDPVSAYNDFAKRFNCQIYSPDRLYWKQDIELGDGVLLRLYGLTSTLLSGAMRHEKQNDVRGGLYLSPLQTVLDPVDNVVNAVLSHHPPDWLMDQDEVDEALSDRAALLFCGHKHKRRFSRETRFVRLHAGAVNPDRQESGWQPCYGLLTLIVAGAGAQRVLQLEARMLEWQSNPGRFRAALDIDDSDVFRHTIAFPCRNNVRTLVNTFAATSPQPTPLPAEIRVEVAMSEKRNRTLIMRFWDLPSSRRYQIALDLGLIEEAEKAIPEPERYGRAFKRAGERGLFERLDQEVTKWERT